MAEKSHMLPQGALVISIDYEFQLGFADFNLSETDKERMQNEVGIISRLLTLFEHYNIPATWAVTGHLLESHCKWEDDTPHPEYPRPIHKHEKRDWFSLHPPKTEYGDPLWFDVRRLVPQILRSPVGHEIASHSYGHIIYGARDVNEEAVRVDIENMKRIHAERKYPLFSFVFPRNREAFHQELKEAGVQCYRGARRMWYRPFPGIVGRALHLVDYFLPTTHTVVPTRGVGGLINLPDSLMLMGRNGLRRVIVPAIMKWKIRRGLMAAAKRGKVFHLWFHPSNFWYDEDGQFEILEETLQYAAALRDNNVLSIQTMRGVCEQARL